MARVRSKHFEGYTRKVQATRSEEVSSIAVAGIVTRQWPAPPLAPTASPPNVLSGGTVADIQSSHNVRVIGASVASDDRSYNRSTMITLESQFQHYLGYLPSASFEGGIVIVVASDDQGVRPSVKLGKSNTGKTETVSGGAYIKIQSGSRDIKVQPGSSARSEIRSISRGGDPATYSIRWLDRGNYVPCSCAGSLEQALIKARLIASRISGCYGPALRDTYGETVDKQARSLTYKETVLPGLSKQAQIDHAFQLESTTMKIRRASLGASNDQALIATKPVSDATRRDQARGCSPVKVIKIESSKHVEVPQGSEVAIPQASLRIIHDRTRQERSIVIGKHTGSVG